MNRRVPDHKLDMTIRDALRRGSVYLKKTGINTSFLDTEILLAYTLNITKERVIAHSEEKIKTSAQRRFFSLIRRRGAREPTAYITGHKEFFGLDFLVNRHTLIPRPETEILVDMVLQHLCHPERERRNSRECGLACARDSSALPQNDNTVVIDIGTGSGAIAVALAKSLQSTTYRLQFFATDISAVALRVARKNAKRHGVKIKFVKGNLIKPIIPTPSHSPSQREGEKPNRTFLPLLAGGDLEGVVTRLIIIANLPYLTTTQWRATQPEIKKYEPRVALDGGPDGLKYYRQLLDQIKKLRLTAYGLRLTLFIEFDPSQTHALTKLVTKTFPAARVEIKKDLAGRNRILIASI